MKGAGSADVNVFGGSHGFENFTLKQSYIEPKLDPSMTYPPIQRYFHFMNTSI